MKLTVFSNILAALVCSSSVLAQDDYYHQSGPFYLRVLSNDSSVDGRYISSCHAGAAIQAACIGSDTTKPAFNSWSSIYYFNYSGPSDQPAGTGQLIWNMPVSGGAGTVVRNVSLPLSLSDIPVSNVAAAMFSVVQSAYVEVGFHNDVLYRPSWIDDSKFEAGVRPNITSSEELGRWYSCWQVLGTYYYQSLAWVYGGAPHNPTCKPVDVIKVNG